MPWLLYICKFFSDFLCSDMSLLFVTVTLRGVSNKHCLLSLFSFEPRCEKGEKTGLRGFRPGPTQTGLYSHRRWLVA